ncbi:MAG: carbohydrate kinase family protein [Alphaproteobacteria bacterium]
MSIKDNYIVAIGGANMDLYAQSHEPLILEDSNIGKLGFSAGGVVRNIAENLARFGSKVFLLSVVGDDIWGKTLIKQTKEAGVETKYCLSLQNRQTSTYLSVHQPSGEMKVAINDMTIVDELSPSYLKHHKALIQQAHIVMIDANLSEQALAYIFSLNHDCVFVDPVSVIKAKRLLPYLNQIKLIKPNHHELAILAGQIVEDEESQNLALKKLHNQGVEYIFLSRGEKGAYMSHKDYLKCFPIIKQDVKNVTGAGDATMAAIAHGYIKGWSWERIGQFAMMAAYITASSSTTINPNITEKMIVEKMESL